MPVCAPVPMLAQLAERLPFGPGWRYEPKLDGFRGLLWRQTAERVQLLSRNTRDLGECFPELVQAGRALEVGTVLDGEIVIADEQGRADFSALQKRLVQRRRRDTGVTLDRSAVLVVFDALQLAGEDVAHLPLSRRRGLLEGVLPGCHPCLQLIEQTADASLANEWLALVPGIEGVVAKRADRPYAAGRCRDWIKVKRRRTADCAVIGVTGDPAARRLVLGLRHSDGNLHHFGLTAALPAGGRDLLTALLEEAGPVEAAIPSRWNHDAVPPRRRVPAVLVCEVAFSTLDGGRWLRQPAAFVRWRPDRSVDDCTLEQLQE